MYKLLDIEANPHSHTRISETYALSGLDRVLPITVFISCMVERHCLEGLELSIIHNTIKNNQ